MGAFRLIWNTTFNNKLLKPQKPFSKFEAWVWMLMESCINEDGNEEPRNFGGKERMIRVEYGEFCHSERFMSEAWGWSRQKVSTFLQHLSSTLDPMITQKVSQQISVISICNFWKYQNPKKAKQASSKPAVSQQQASSKPNLNNRTSKQINNKAKDMFRTTEEVVTEPLNGKFKKFSDFNWSKDLLNIIGKYPTLKLSTSDDIKNVEFWDGHVKKFQHSFNIFRPL